VGSTVISKRPIDYRPFYTWRAEGVSGLQLSQQQSKKDSEPVVRRCKYLPKLVSAHKNPYKTQGLNCLKIALKA